MSDKCKKCNEKVVPGKRHCQKHLDLLAARARDRVGLCKQCSQPAVDGKSRCAKHQEEIRIKSAQRKALLRASGLCRDCGKKAQEGLVHCIECGNKYAVKNALLVKERQEQGLCTCCGGEKEKPEAAYCNNCITKDNERLKRTRRERFSKGYCVRCNKKHETGKYTCFDCSLEYRVRIAIINVITRRRVSSKVPFEEILGCSISFFRQHIKNLMEPWMNEGNYGVHVPGEKRWQLGHIIPSASFNLSDSEQLKKCFNYTNLCPQEAEENVVFGDLMFLDGQLVRGRDIRSK